MNWNSYWKFTQRHHLLLNQSNHNSNMSIQILLHLHHHHQQVDFHQDRNSPIFGKLIVTKLSSLDGCTPVPKKLNSTPIKIPNATFVAVVGLLFFQKLSWT